MKGGKREGAGRKPGSKTKKTADIALKAAEEGKTPLEYMLEVMRDDNTQDGRRDDMAKAAAPYMHPRLQSTELKGTGQDGDIPLTFTVKYVDADNSGTPGKT